MKAVIRVSLLIGIALALTSCSTISMRVNEKSAVFYSLDEPTRAKIANGEVDLGFSPEMVYIALGTPDVRRQRLSPEGSSETWVYRSYYGYGHYPAWDWGGGYYGSRYGYSPYAYGGFHTLYWPRPSRGFRANRDDDTRITFRNNRVVMIDRRRK